MELYLKTHFLNIGKAQALASLLSSFHLHRGSLHQGEEDNVRQQFSLCWLSMYLSITILWDQPYPQHLSGCKCKESTRFPLARDCAIPIPWFIPIDRGSAGTLDSRVVVLKLRVISAASDSSFHWLVLLPVVNVTALKRSIRKGADLGQLRPLAW